MSRPTRLYALDIDETSLVDGGAHPESRVLFWKRDPELDEDVSKAEPTPADTTTAMPLGERLKKLRDKKKAGRSVTQEDVSRSLDADDGDTTRSDEENEDMPKPENKAAGDEPKVNLDELPEEVAKYYQEAEEYMDTLEAEVSKREERIESLEERIAKLEGGEEVSKSDDEPDPEEVIKSADPAVQAIFEKVSKRASDMEAKLSEFEKRERQREEREALERFTTIAKSYRGLPTGMDAGEFGEVLKSLAEADPESFSKVKEVLDGADAALAESALFEEVGKSGTYEPGPGSATETRAKELVSKGQADSIEEARVMALEMDPSEYERQVAEQHRRAGGR